MDNKLVVIADDERDIQKFMKTLIGFFGYQALTVDDGQQAIAAAIQHQPTLILMDLFMPNLDGFKAISRLKQDPATMHIPIIAFSGLYMDGPVRARLLDQGCVGFLSKPINTDDLYQSMTQAIHGRKPESPPQDEEPTLKITYKNDARKSIKRLIKFFKN